MVSESSRRLKAAQERARRRAAGKPAAPVPADAVLVGPQDIPEVERFIRQSAGPTGVGLWNATELDED